MPIKIPIINPVTGAKTFVTAPDPNVTGSSFPDGFSASPGNAPQRPTLFSGYVTRPPWKVAGVDPGYGVGPTAGLVLKNPNNFPAPPGTHKNGQSFHVDADNAEIIGWNLAVDGGWTIEAENASNPIITDNAFKIGSNGYAPIALLGEPNGYIGKGATILRNSIDCDGKRGGFAAPIFMSRSGVFKIQYNWVKNVYEDLIAMGGGGSASPNEASYDVRFNLMENSGQGIGHPDIVQTFSGNKYGQIVIDFNTIVIDNSQGTQGLVLQGNQNSPLSTFKGGSVSSNTFVLKIPAGLMNFGIGIAVGQSTGPWAAKTNYVDPSSLSPITLFLKNFQGGSQVGGSAVGQGNVNLKTGDGVGLNNFS